MFSKILKLFLSGALALAVSYGTSAQDVIVHSHSITGPVKQMNCVNNPPTKKNFQAYKALKIPYMRTHDTALTSKGSYGGSFVVDISNIFPDFSKDVNDPASYRFEETDVLLKRTLDAGTKVLFRLGQSIENGDNPIKRYVFPPKDFKKWAEICEHIVRHYNENWAEGHSWNIEYWEIWNEPDLDLPDERRANPQMWGGTVEQFFELYGTAAKHLKKCFPSIKVGGPAFCRTVSVSVPMIDGFFKYVSEHNVPLDFFSYHCYVDRVEAMMERIDAANALLEKYGYGDVETWLDEWNLNNFRVKGNYFPRARSSIKGGAFVSAVMSACQYKKIGKLMYYDMRPMTSYNGVFEPYTQNPLPSYYAFYAWRKLADLGSSVKVDVSKSDVFASAAVGDDGRRGVLVSRYNWDDNVAEQKVVRVEVKGLNPSITEVFGYLTDDCRSFTEVPLAVENGVISVTMRPQSFVYVQLEPGSVASL